MTRADPLERYRALPLPTTKDEHWRFTDLKGFDPDAWTANGATEIAAPETILELDAAGVAVVAEAGIEIESAPDGVRFEPLPDDHRAPLLARRLGREVRCAQRGDVDRTGCSSHVPRGVVLEKPLYVRIANSVEGGSLFWRLLVVAEPESRFTLIEEYASASPELAGTRTLPSRSWCSRLRRSSTCPSRTSRARHGTSRRTTRGWSATRSSTGSRAASAREGQDPDPERPRGARCDLACDRRLLR